MADRVNLADPDCEPTDEQLLGLSLRAFAHVRGQNELQLRQLRERIAQGRAALRKQLELSGVNSLSPGSKLGNRVFDMKIR